jgi:general secretion pathway protein D
MMSGVFKQNYLMTDAVKAVGSRFTIKMTEDLKVENAFQLFKQVLAMYNVSVEKKQNTYVFDQVKAAVVTFKGPVIYGRRIPQRFPVNDDDEVVFMVPFYNITPEALKAIIQAQLPGQAMVFPVNELNLLVINGSYEDIKYILSFIDLLDRAQFKDKTILMVTPEFWDIDDFELKVKELLAAEGVSLDAMEKTRAIMFIPIEKLNSLIVISSVKEWVERVLYWLKKLDVPEAAGEAKKVYAYKLRNVDVEAVAEVLQAYRSGTMGGGYGSSLLRGQRTTGARTTKDKTGKTTRTTGRTGRTTPSIRSRIAQRAAGYGDEEGMDEVAIVPVLETNSIVIVATPVEYKKYLDIIKRIDVPRNQVFVEVIIGEVTLDKSTQLGLEFWINRYLYQTSFGTKGGLGVYQGQDEQGNDLVTPGTNFFLNGTLPGSQFEILLNALVENSKINIISTPKITVLENEEAEISVGSDVPVISSESGITGGQTAGGTGYYPFRSVQYINTGIILKVKAAILSGNKISLEIEQEISEALENKKSEISSPEILKRTIKTTMLVNEGEIAFIGGLFQNKLTTAGSGIPVLSRIPLLGNLFKNSRRQVRKNELVVFINSKTLRKSNDMREIVEGVKKMFSDQIYTGIETNKTNDIDENRENK